MKKTSRLLEWVRDRIKLGYNHGTVFLVTIITKLKSGQRHLVYLWKANRKMVARLFAHLLCGQIFSFVTWLLHTVLLGVVKNIPLHGYIDKAISEDSFVIDGGMKNVSFKLIIPLVKKCIPGCPQRKELLVRAQDWKQAKCLLIGKWLINDGMFIIEASCTLV